MQDLRMDKPTLTGRKYNMKSNVMIYIDKIIDIYTAPKMERQVQIFQKVDAHGKMHYGCRFFIKEVFQCDEFYPNKSLHYAESSAENYIIGVKN